MGPGVPFMGLSDHTRLALRWYPRFSLRILIMGLIDAVPIWGALRYRSEHLQGLHVNLKAFLRGA